MLPISTFANQEQFRVPHYEKKYRNKRNMGKLIISEKLPAMQKVSIDTNNQTLSKHSVREHHKTPQ